MSGNRIQTGVILLATMLLAGCSTPPDDQTAPPKDIQSGPSEPINSGEIRPNPIGLPSLRMQMNDCEGMLAAPLMNADLVGATPPQGWEPWPGPVIEVYIRVLTCQRFSLGDFERPLNLLIETHENRSTPEKCAEGLGEDFYSVDILHQIWVDDPDVLDFLLGLGMPARLGTMSNEQTSIGDGRTITWTFTTAGFEPATLTTSTTQNATARQSNIVRHYWSNQLGGVSALNMDTEWHYNGQGSGPFIGLVGDPFLHVPGVETFAATGSFAFEASLDAPFHQWGDPLCEQPVPFS